MGSRKEELAGNERCSAEMFPIPRSYASKADHPWPIVDFIRNPTRNVEEVSIGTTTLDFCESKKFTLYRN